MSYSILPADRYKIVNRTILSNLDQEYLINFYSPIIGPLATSLYLIMWQSIENGSSESIYQNHHHLMSLLKCNSVSLKDARESLEAVGLVKTYVKEENVLNYIYEIYSPLSPTEFFSHPILNVVLYNNIGNDEYNNLLKNYQKKKYDYSDYVEITKQMDEVYKSESFVEASNIKEREICTTKLSSKIDYDMIASSIPKDLLSEKAFTKKTRELIDNLSFIYNVDSLQMVGFIRSSLNEFGMIDKELLRKTVSKYYQFSSNSLPTIVYRKQPEYLKKASGDQSIRGKIVTMFENISPYDFLKRKNNGTNPNSRDLKLVEELLVDQELTPAVVNVLLDFCLRKNNNKLTSNYVLTIAGQWKRAGLKTAEEAMNFAEKEHKKSLKKDVKETKKVIEPTWFNKNIEESIASEAEQQELKDFLGEFN